MVSGLSTVNIGNQYINIKMMYLEAAAPERSPVPMEMSPLKFLLEWANTKFTIHPPKNKTKCPSSLCSQHAKHEDCSPLFLFLSVYTQSAPRSCQFNLLNT